MQTVKEEKITSAQELAEHLTDCLFVRMQWDIDDYMEDNLLYLIDCYDGDDRQEYGDTLEEFWRNIEPVIIVKSERRS